MRSSMLLLGLAVASGIFPGCRKERLEQGSAGGVSFALPKWPTQARHADAANGYVERAEGDQRISLAWDMDPRPGPASGDEIPGEPLADAQVDGHAAKVLKAPHGTAVVWRCDKSARLFRLVTTRDDAAALAQRVRCHAVGAVGNGDVPNAASAVLGPDWRFGNRGKGSISWLRDDGVLTFFAGQQLPSPHDPDAAKRAAPGWIAAAGLSKPQVTEAEPANGPQGHPALRVRGTALLEGRPVRWSLIFWRCLQRQLSFAAVVFSREAPDEPALLSARCHA